MQLRGLMGWLVTVLVAVFGFGPTTTVGATPCRYDGAAANASSVTYDAPHVARVVVQTSVASGAGSHQLTDSLELSAPPLTTARVTSTTPSAPSVATNTANGGAATVRVGQAGEAAVRGAYDIGPKATAVVNGRARIFDGLNGVAVTEVKNVGYQAYTQQLKDSLAYAQQNGLQFDLFVRGGASPTVLSGPLQDAIVSTPGFNVRFIP